MSPGYSSFPRRRTATRWRDRSPGPVVVRVPVKRIGRRAALDYCDQCGQKRRACQCPRAKQQEA